MTRVEMVNREKYSRQILFQPIGAGATEQTGPQEPLA